MANPEVYHDAERTTEIEKAAGERAAELREKAEALDEKEVQSGHSAEEARIEAEKQAKPTESYRPSTETEKTNRINPQSSERTYYQTMQNVQEQLSAPSRVFSKIIHNKTIEKTSDIVGQTIARPHALLSGAICAFVLVLILYIHARYFGYALSGFESIAAFAIGWILGILFDLLRAAFKGRH